MQESSVPAAFTVPPDANLTDMVFDNAERWPQDAAFSRRTAGGWATVTTTEFRDQVLALAKGLVTQGVEPGDRVALISRTAYEWTLTDYAIWCVGATTVPVYETSSAEQVAWILGDSGAVLAVVETPAHAATVESVRSELPALRSVHQFEAGAVDELSRAGVGVPDEEIDRRRSTLRADSLATLIYTSGTTGRPKGCELTHGNLLFDALAVSEGAGELMRSGQSTLLFLPLAHVFARVIQTSCVHARATIAHTADIKNLLADFAGFRPTFILSVPRIFEKVHAQAKQKAHASGKGGVFDKAERVAIAWSEALERGRVSPLLRLQHAVFDKLVYGKLRAALGGRVRFAVSGGAPLGARLGHFFRGSGVVVLEGYGLTETTAGATLNRPDRMKVGTVGPPLPGVSVRIAADGEILLKGGHIFRGYWKNPTATAEALEPDGWFHTGDMGELDDDSFLRITGRKKELIVTAGGKNVAPAVLEDRVRAHPLVSQAMVVGDNQPFVAALVTIDLEAFTAWKAAKDKPAAATVDDLRQDPDLRSDIQTAIDGANAAVSKAEAIRAFRILGVDWTEEGGQLTPTMKLKRSVVAKEFAPDIDTLYA